MTNAAANADDLVLEAIYIKNAAPLPPECTWPGGQVVTAKSWEWTNAAPEKPRELHGTFVMLELPKWEQQMTVKARVQSVEEQVGQATAGGAVGVIIAIANAKKKTFRVPKEVAASFEITECSIPIIVMQSSDAARLLKCGGALIQDRGMRSVPFRVSWPLICGKFHW